MSINFKAPEADLDLKPRIVVVGVGGAGGNAVNNMIRSNLEGVEFVVANTDAQALKHSQADRKIQLGHTVTQGLGAGARPEVGREAAIESMDEALGHIDGANMVFFTAGMGGGTGTGAAPVLAEACRDRGMLTVGVVTKPFHFEGQHRMRAAEQGIEELQQFVDTLIIIPNQNLFRVANEKTTFAEAFTMADDVLYAGVRGVTDLMVMPGLINLDFADIRTVMSEMGKAMMGTGESDGDNRAILAAESAISNPLLEDVSMKGARGVLINITGGSDMTLFEVDEAANRIREEVDADANIIFGSTFDDLLDGKMRVSVVATGIDSDLASMPRPARTMVAPLRAATPPPAHSESFDAPATAIAEAPSDPIAQDPSHAADTAFAQEIQPVESVTENQGLGEQIDLEAMVAEAPEEADQEHLAHLATDSFFEPTDQPEAGPEVGSEPQVSAPLSASQTAPEPVRPKDAFIPPKAVRPEELNRGSRAGAATPEPFNEAALVNAGETNAGEVNAGESERPAKRSLFDRMTGLNLTGSRTGAEPTDPHTGQPHAIAQTAEPSFRQAEAPAALQPGSPQPATGYATTGQPTTGHATASQDHGVTQGGPAPGPQADLGTTKADEEMLQIPAFLRRQAN